LDKALVKQAYSEAEDSLKQKQVDEVKKIVLKTLEKIESLKTDKEKAQENVKEIEEKIKLLKLDIDDLKEGRLDRITERQEKDQRAKETSVVIIIKETRVDHDYPWWYWPYRIVWPEVPVYPQITWTATTNSTYGGSWDCYVTNSAAKFGAIGTYCLSDGNTVNLR